MWQRYSNTGYPLDCNTNATLVYNVIASKPHPAQLLAPNCPQVTFVFALTERINARNEQSWEI